MSEVVPGPASSNGIASAFKSEVESMWRKFSFPWKRNCQFYHETSSTIKMLDIGFFKNKSRGSIKDDWIKRSRSLLSIEQKGYCYLNK